eukprot:scaffold71255_cov23-Tisochrysis_lutea.AAC.7
MAGARYVQRVASLCTKGSNIRRVLTCACVPQRTPWACCCAGADLHALCSSAVLHAAKRHHPKLMHDPTAVVARAMHGSLDSGGQQQQQQSHPLYSAALEAPAAPAAPAAAGAALVPAAALPTPGLRLTGGHDGNIGETVGMDFEVEKGEEEGEEANRIQAEGSRGVVQRESRRWGAAAVGGTGVIAQSESAPPVTADAAARAAAAPPPPPPPSPSLPPVQEAEPSVRRTGHRAHVDEGAAKHKGSANASGRGAGSGGSGGALPAPSFLSELSNFAQQLKQQPRRGRTEKAGTAGGTNAGSSATAAGLLPHTQAHPQPFAAAAAA